MKVLITGGAGFIGSNLADGLLREGHEVRILDNFSTGHRGNIAHIADDIDIVEGDLRSYERVSRAVRGCEAVFHEGAMPSVPRSPLTSSEINIGGTLNVILAAVTRAPSASCSPRRPPCTATRPGSRASRRRRRARSRPTPSPSSPPSSSAASPTSSTASRPSPCVFGRRQDPFSQYSAVIPKFTIAMKEGRSPTIYGDGTQSRDFTHIDDVVAANLLAMKAPAAAGKIFNIACGRQVSLNDLVSELNAVLETQIEATYVEPRAGDVKHSLAEVGRTERELDFRSQVEFGEGLRRTVEAYEPSTRATTAN